MEENNETEFYLTTINAILDEFTSLIGTKTTMIQARKAPLQIDADGTVTGFYGDGAEALDILTQQFEEVFGTTMARTRIQVALEEVAETEDERLPERIRPEDSTSEKGLFEWFRDVLWRANT